MECTWDWALWLWSEVSELSGCFVSLAVESSDVAVEVSGTDMPDDDEANPGISPQSDTELSEAAFIDPVVIEATTA